MYGKLLICSRLDTDCLTFRLMLYASSLLRAAADMQVSRGNFFYYFLLWQLILVFLLFWYFASMTQYLCDCWEVKTIGVIGCLVLKCLYAGACPALGRHPLILSNNLSFDGLRNLHWRNHKELQIIFTVADKRSTEYTMNFIYLVGADVFAWIFRFVVYRKTLSTTLLVL